jgi:hypothetical protein
MLAARGEASPVFLFPYRSFVDVRAMLLLLLSLLVCLLCFCDVVLLGCRRCERTQDGQLQAADDGDSLLALDKEEFARDRDRLRELRRRLAREQHDAYENLLEDGQQVRAQTCACVCSRQCVRVCQGVGVWVCVCRPLLFLMVG